MSIFRRENDPSPEPPAPARPARPAPPAPAKKESAGAGSTQIARGSKVVGEISGTADLTVDGVVDGEIDLESRVVVGSDGRVEGKIFARTVEIGGKVLGNVQGGERVEVLTTGRIEGDVLSPRVVIADGAFLKGKVEMTDKVPVREASRKASPSKEAPSEAPPPKAGVAAGPAQVGSKPANRSEPPAAARNDARRGRG